jgi:hypothetical protein
VSKIRRMTREVGEREQEARRTPAIVVGSKIPGSGRCTENRSLAATSFTSRQVKIPDTEMSVRYLLTANLKD